MKLQDPRLEALLESYRADRRPTTAMREQLWHDANAGWYDENDEPPPGVRKPTRYGRTRAEVQRFSIVPALINHTTVSLVLKDEDDAELGRVELRLTHESQTRSFTEWVCITAIDPAVVKALQDDQFIPVISPIGFGEANESYNINADLVAAKLATVLKAEKLIMLTNIKGVLNKAGELITELTPRQIDELVADGTISGGMLPKLAGAIDAAKSGVNAVHVVDGRVPHAMLLEILTDQAYGTMIRSH